MYLPTYFILTHNDNRHRQYLDIKEQKGVRFSFAGGNSRYTSNGRSENGFRLCDRRDKYDPTINRMTFAI